MRILTYIFDFKRIYITPTSRRSGQGSESYGNMTPAQLLIVAFRGGGTKETETCLAALAAIENPSSFRDLDGFCWPRRGCGPQCYGRPGARAPEEMNDGSQETGQKNRARQEIRGQKGRHTGQKIRSSRQAGAAGGEACHAGAAADGSTRPADGPGIRRRQARGQGALQILRFGRPPARFARRSGGAPGAGATG